MLILTQTEHMSLQEDPEEHRDLPTDFLKRVRDFAQVKYNGHINKDVADYALNLLDVDRDGLDRNDRVILTTIVDKFDGGPVGIETLAASIGEDSGTLEDVYEPYLIQNGYINRTPRGRVATKAKLMIILAGHSNKNNIKYSKECVL